MKSGLEVDERDDMSMSLDRARCGRGDARDDFQKRRLPAPVWTDDTLPSPLS